MYLCSYNSLLLEHHIAIWDVVNSYLELNNSVFPSALADENDYSFVIWEVRLTELS